MGNLKPIGSERLTGQEKINRIMEIARFNETTPSKVNETSRSEYSVVLADNNEYHVVKERQGYIIKRSISESETEYIDPIKNRKYHSSYSQAFKKLNLLAGELNRLNENNEGLSLYGEQKKFVLKTPNQPKDIETPTDPPSEPPSVPSPELPSPNSEMDDMPSDDSELDINLDSDGGEDMSMDIDMSSDDSNSGDEQVTFKSIQKLTGKLTQKIRTLNDMESMSSEDIKYVINMVLSSLNLSELSEEDKEDIMSKFEDEDMSSDDIDMEGDIPSGDFDDNSDVDDTSMDEPIETNHMTYGGSILDSIFSESRVDKVLGKYFEKSEKEISETKIMKSSTILEKKEMINRTMKQVIRYCESIEQELASSKLLKENSNYVFVGKTNKLNLVFENSSGQVKITPDGMVI
jgi:hypothetical protein